MTTTGRLHPSSAQNPRTRLLLVFCADSNHFFYLIKKSGASPRSPASQLHENTERAWREGVVILITQERDEEHSKIYSGLAKYCTKLRELSLLLDT